MTPSEALLRLLAAREALHNRPFRYDSAFTLAAACNAYDEAVYAMYRRAQLALPATETPRTPSERHAGN